MFSNNENKLLLDIYQLAQISKPEDFKQCLCSRFKQELAFDKAMWMSRSEIESPYSSDESFVYGVSPEIMEDYSRSAEVFKQAQDLTQYLASHINQVVDLEEVMTDSQFKSSALYLKHCQIYDIEYAIMVLLFDDSNGIFHSFSLTRGKQKSAFSLGEREHLQNLVPHIMQARRINTLASFTQEYTNGGVYRGIVDKHGEIIQAQTSFIKLLTQAKLISNNKVDLTSVKDLETYQGTPLGNKAKLTVSIQQQMGDLYLSVVKQNITHLLTLKKQTICKLLIQGLTNKEIAKVMNISDETVNEHLQELYSILDVKTRNQAIKYLLKHDVEQILLHA